MEISRRVVGVAVVDERPLAGRTVGWMFIVGAVVTTLLPLLPGADGKVLTPTLPIGIAAFVWGLFAAFKVDWRSAPGWIMHLSTVLGALSIAVATHDTGGADSPARLLIMLVLVFASYYFPAREACPYLALILALHELPLAYDPTALDSGLLGELVNTRQGHPGGDRALIFVADCLRDSCRAGDLPARLGGDEFAILVPGASSDGMAALAVRLLDTVRRGDSVRVSVGWAITAGPDESLLHDADDALAAAKRAGKDRALASARI